MPMKARKPTARAIWPPSFPRADRDALALFDPRLKICIMNCGPSTLDPRPAAERRFLCDDCMPVPDPRALP